jgi:hypothetical protein
MQEDKDPYSDYDLDDWQWEFLRRNPRYIKAYKAVEWLKKRLNKKKGKVKRSASFNAFGIQCSFSWRRHGEDEVWYEDWWVYYGSTHKTKTGEIRRNNLASGKVLELPSPDSNANEYKEQLAGFYPTLLRRSVAAVSEIDKDMLLEDVLGHHEIAVVIDTRHASGTILSEIKSLLQDYQPRKRHYLTLYPEYLAVWDLRKEGLTDAQIVEQLWPDLYETIGCRDDIGNKTFVLQRVYDYESAANILIKDSFPPKRHFPKIKK